MTHRGPFQPLLFCDSVILLFQPDTYERDLGEKIPMVRFTIPCQISILEVEIQCCGFPFIVLSYVCFGETCYY